MVQAQVARFGLFQNKGVQMNPMIERRMNQWIVNRKKKYLLLQEQSSFY